MLSYTSVNDCLVAMLLEDKYVGTRLRNNVYLAASYCVVNSGHEPGILDKSDITD